MCLLSFEDSLCVCVCSPVSNVLQMNCISFDRIVCSVSVAHSALSDNSVHNSVELIINTFSSS